MTLAEVALAAWCASQGPSYKIRITRSTRELETTMSSLSGYFARQWTMTPLLNEVSSRICARHLRWPLKGARLSADGVLCSSIHSCSCLSSGSGDCAVPNSSLVGIWKSLTCIPPREIGRPMRGAATSRWLKDLGKGYSESSSS